MTIYGKPAPIRYDEGCLAAHALNLVGDRWALMVVRELIFAPKRFGMLRAGLPGISASVLNGRLAQLQAAGILSHDRRLGIYALTPAGQGLL
ncbi:MAG: winged helix-turn-helix transcriptional regulator, partial [Paracoccus sp. (in: a-proteobacteria)]